MVLTSGCFFPVIEDALRIIESHFSVALGDAASVEDSLVTLQRELERCDPDLVLECHHRLLPLLAERKGPLAHALFRFFEMEIHRRSDRSELLLGMFQAREEALRIRTFELMLDLVEKQILTPTFPLLLPVARLAEEENSPFGKPQVLSRMSALLRKFPSSELPPLSEDPVESLFLAGSPVLLRCLAARILDLQQEPIPESRVIRLLGAEAARFLMTYLQYTRATHRDLVDLTPYPLSPSPALPSLLEAERILGKSVLATVLAELGWSRIVWGLSVQPVVGVSFDAGFPFVLRPQEAALLENVSPSRRLWERFLVIAHGGTREDTEDGYAAETVQRFRRYNVAHAEVLSELLKVAPLIAPRVHQLLEQMDQIVEDFQALFRNESEDALRLPQVYGELRAKILAGMQQDADSGMENHGLSSDAVRLVQMFEDPHSLDEVHTLHGLKRYLHQQGLHHAFRLFRSGSATNRSVDLVLASSRSSRLRIVRRIRYLDFEPQEDADRKPLPFVVGLAVEGFARQLLHGRQAFPNLEILIYGNEVQIYAGFRNHPAFLRIDFSPPLRGGMIDLEYFGVSQYEMDQHPDLTLQAIQRLFRRMEFDVRKDGFRLQARYDRERAFDFGDVTEKARLLFCLVPYLMDVDWVIGSLDYPDSTRRIVADAWAEFFLAWGVLPVEDVLTADRRKILQAKAPSPAGEQEVPWNGHDPYQDLYSGTPRANLLDLFRSELDSRGLHSAQRMLQESRPSQLTLEQDILEPLREACKRGEVRETSDGLIPSPSVLFTCEQAAVRFARILADGGKRLLEAVRLSGLIAFVDRQLQFQTNGSVQGYPVQRANLHLRGERVGLFVLRNKEGLIALALAARDGVLYRNREDEAAPWQDRGELEETDLAFRLRRDNYLGAGYESIRTSNEDIARLTVTFKTPNPHPFPRITPGERIVACVAAAPGRATGFVRFGEPGRLPSDFDGTIYTAPAIRPEDAPYILRAAGVMSTGGGILSHAGLVALELQKPALIIAGHWQREPGRAAILRYRLPVFTENEIFVNGYHVISQADYSEQEERLQEGDLVVLDAEEATLTVLGQDRDTLSFHLGLRQIEAATGSMEASPDEREILLLRGRLVHAMHQSRKILSRTKNPALARHAVRELLTAPEERQSRTGGASRAQLLRILFANPYCYRVTQETAIRWISTLERRHEALSREAIAIIPKLGNLFEILFLRLQVLRLRSLLAEVTVILRESGLESLRDWEQPDIDALVVDRLKQLHQFPPSGERALPSSLPTGTESRPTEYWNVLGAKDGGRELAPFIGRKAANLGEIARILGAEYVPAWFAVTDHAFRTVLSTPAGKATAEVGLDSSLPYTLGQAIEEILKQHDMDAERKSAAIRHLWLTVPLPEDLKTVVLQAYRALNEIGSAAGQKQEVFVAIRSSAFEEDTEQTAFPGQFDTFLFIRGEQALVDHLRLAWAGLWTERAIRLRSMLGSSGHPFGGGVIVQKVLHSRISGVAHTVSLATGRLTEMTINVGLGLGEGVVSGAVDVDHIQVKKMQVPEDKTGTRLDFRYRVGDKREQIVFDARAGQGTRKVEAQYHQRLRPALEYTELCDLVRVAERLEAVFAEPLDIEFAYEGHSLYVLQIRPISVFHAALRDTLSRYPLKPQRQPFGERNKEKKP